MRKYTFYFDGLDRTVVIVSDSEKSARKLAWNNLAHSERDRTISIECIEQEETVLA